MLRLVKIPAEKVWLPEERAELVEKILHAQVVDLRRYDFLKDGKGYRGWMVIYPHDPE